MFKKIISFFICFSALSAPIYAKSTSSEASVVICADTNQVLFAQNHHKRLGMASTTKIMTALLALENGNTTDMVTISANAANQEGSSIYLKAGEKVSLHNLLYGLMLNSGNDAAMAIAEHISGSSDEFVVLMNEKAKELGLKNTCFQNPSGLPDKKHFSTAYDMSIIMSYAMKNDEFAKITNTKEYKIETDNTVTYLKNHNKLLWKYPHTIGGKTGYTKAAGRCFVSSAKKDGVTLVCVTLNDKDDWNDHQTLLDYGFSKAQVTPVLSKNDILCTKTIHGVRLNILSENDLSLPLKNGKKQKITIRVILDEAINENINYGTHLGIGQVYVGNHHVATIDLISGQSISSARKNMFSDIFNDIFKNVLFNS